MWGNSMSVGDALEHLVTVIEDQQLIRERVALAKGLMEQPYDQGRNRKVCDILEAIGGCASESSDFALKAMREIIQES